MVEANCPTPHQLLSRDGRTVDSFIHGFRSADVLLYTDCKADICTLFYEAANPWGAPQGWPLWPWP